MPRVLIVEDNPYARAAMTALLETEGHDVVSAFTAEAAIRLLAGEAFDLVLLDIILDEDRTAPTGWAVAAFMQSDDRLKDVPLIVVSGLAPEEVRAGAMSYANKLVGASLIFGKPVDGDGLLHAIGQLLGAKGTKP